MVGLLDNTTYSMVVQLIEVEIMSLNTDIVKIKMIKEGYLPNYPPHMISDNEMCEAFLPMDYPITDSEWDRFMGDDNLSMFKDYYALPDKSLEPQYRELVSGIAKELKAFCDSTSDDRAIPDWILSYMNHSTISNSSDYLDIDGLAILFGIDSLEPEFNGQLSTYCYQVSSSWLKRTNQTDRPATIFGEPHVIKYLRLLKSNG